MERPPEPESKEPESNGDLARRFGPDESHCELCGFALSLERHCKIICPNCGYTRDCSDP